MNIDTACGGEHGDGCGPRARMPAGGGKTALSRICASSCTSCLSFPDVGQALQYSCSIPAVPPSAPVRIFAPAIVHCMRRLEAGHFRPVFVSHAG
ncbi:MAG: hypothetical protein ACRYHA_10155 [Janthinobacterium lividum]